MPSETKPGISLPNTAQLVWNILTEHGVAAANGFLRAEYVRLEQSKARGAKAVEVAALRAELDRIGQELDRKAAG